MARVKTAISIDKNLLEMATRIAGEMDITRSQVVSTALEEFIQRYRNKKLLAQINDAYSDAPGEDEIGTMEIMRSLRRKPGNRRIG